jgi:hypothetical protein
MVDINAGYPALPWVPEIGAKASKDDESLPLPGNCLFSNPLAKGLLSKQHPDRINFWRDTGKLVIIEAGFSHDHERIIPGTDMPAIRRACNLSNRSREFDTSSC